MDASMVIGKTFKFIVWSLTVGGVVFFSFEVGRLTGATRATRVFEEKSGGSVFFLNEEPERVHIFTATGKQLGVTHITSGQKKFTITLVMGEED